MPSGRTDLSLWARGVWDDQEEEEEREILRDTRKGGGGGGEDELYTWYHIIEKTWENEYKID